MRDLKIFNQCVQRLESRFGHGTEQLMLNLAGIANAELEKLGRGYDKEAIEALANLYEELHRGGRKLTRNRGHLSKEDVETLVECYGRALDASLSPRLLRRNISCNQDNGSIFVEVAGSEPRLAFRIFNFYGGNIPDFNRGILGQVESRSSNGILEYAKQPIYLRLQ